MSKTFSTPNEKLVVAGLGSLKEVGRCAKYISGKHNPRAFVIRGNSDRYDDVLKDYLHDDGIEMGYCFDVHGEPVLSQGQRCIDLIRREKYDVIIAIGGGSVLDMAKASAAIAPNLNYEYLVDCTQLVTPANKLKLEKLPLPKIAIPTTAGSGSETTKVSVFVDDSDNDKNNWKKTVIYHDRLFYDISIIDGSLLESLPSNYTRSTAFDAFAHAIEAFTCRDPNSESDEHALQAMKLIIENLTTAYKKGDDLKSRQNMSEAAMHAGIALANSRSGAIHGLGLPLYSLGLNHGEAVSLLLPHVVEFNSNGRPSDYKDYDASMDRFKRVSDMFGRTDVNAGIRELADSVELPEKASGLREGHVDELVNEAFKLNGERLLKPSVRRVTMDAAREIYLQVAEK